MQATEHVVLADRYGRPAGTLPKREAHSATTPLHLAFSVHVVGADDGVLLTRRAATKPTWPGVWSNACCGHPQHGESLRQAVTRRLEQELGVRPRRLTVAIPDFTYRATMPDGIVEHELCPVVVAEVDGPFAPNPAEVDDLKWIGWSELQNRVTNEPASLSPWSVAQLSELDAMGWSPDAWRSGLAGESAALLDVIPSFGRDAGGPASAAALEPVRAPLCAVLHRFLDERAAMLTAIDPALADVVGEIHALVDAGGKRLRPSFVHWGNRAAGGLDDHAALHVGGAVELVHTFALLHDDVMDRSAQRRGRPSAHVALADLHRTTGGLGSSERFGTSAAVLAGDLAFVWANELLDRARPSERVRRAFATLCNEVMAGQYLDLVLAADGAADERAARKVAMLKSARYTVTRPLQLGAALAPDGGAAVADALATYGDAVGLAFQLRDDVLGVFGDPRDTGKSTLDDLREGKRTLMVLRALRLADDAQRRVLLGALGDPELDDAGADAARSVIADTGALASIEVLLRAQHATASAALDLVPEPARAALCDLASLAIHRSR